MKAFLRKTRWTEEVLLLSEEMRRVLRYLRWQIQWWESQDCSLANLVPVPIPGLEGGKRAYARRQAHMYRALQTKFLKTWAKIDGVQSF